MYGEGFMDGYRAAVEVLKIVMDERRGDKG